MYLPNVCISIEITRVVLLFTLLLSLDTLDSLSLCCVLEAHQPALTKQATLLCIGHLTMVISFVYIYMCVFY